MAERATAQARQPWLLALSELACAQTKRSISPVRTTGGDMRETTLNLMGQRFVPRRQAEPGGTLEQQSHALFERAAAALAARACARRHGALARIRTHARGAGKLVSGVRGKVFAGTARTSATSRRPISHPLPKSGSICCDGGARPGRARQVSEHTPVQPFIRHPHGADGVPRRQPAKPCDAARRYRDILTRAGALLANRLRGAISRVVLPAPGETRTRCSTASRQPPPCRSIIASRAGRWLFAARQAIEIEITAKR
jgi:hypothetical protein